MAKFPSWLRVPEPIKEWTEVLSLAQFIYSTVLPMTGVTFLGIFADASPAQWGIMLLVGVACVLLLLNIQAKKKSTVSEAKIEQVNDIMPDESKMTPARDLTGPYLNGHEFRISDLVREHIVITGKTFENCTIWGPAILGVLPGCSMYDCSHLKEDTVDSILYEIDHERACVGVIGIQDCCFRKCNFRRVGFMGDRRFIEKFKANSQEA